MFADPTSAAEMLFSLMPPGSQQQTCGFRALGLWAQGFRV